MRRRAAAALAVTGALVLAGCDGPGGSGSGGTADLSVGSAYMPQPVSDMAAGFLTITNEGDAADRLTSVSSDVAGRVTVHETVDGAMQEADGLDIPAHGSLVLESGGSHLMFEQLKRKPRQGQKVPVELAFAHSAPVTVEIPVKAATYTPKAGRTTGSETGHETGH
ncbi:copper chaperone PCu(A)C [Streptomyces sp. Tu 3180]|uniref:copper chaperone PCu(A)C n=1 Tax=Streptomyces sp. Tu 3180 TaxID=2682611 RepID=UPI00135BB477|nr:copper chaperone PCu(A)C [Streptomyces sp. Tu 3180]KAF3466311.1 copper chaperone PCu(A)C [Streptomyces sp. Tu 3180]